MTHVHSMERGIAWPGLALVRDAGTRFLQREGRALDRSGDS
jgi:hypothetical protein